MFGRYSRYQKKVRNFILFGQSYWLQLNIKICKKLTGTEACIVSSKPDKRRFVKTGPTC